MKKFYQLNIFYASQKQLLTKTKNWRSLKAVSFILIALVSFFNYAQEDVTTTYLTNAGFDLEPNYYSGGTETVSTTDPSNTHDIPGWTVAVSAPWSAAAAFEFGWAGVFNGVSAPATGSDGAAGTGHAALGLTAGWSGSLAYGQDVTLPAGIYELQIAHSFVGNTEIAANLSGWKGDDGYEVLSSVNSVANAGIWQTTSVTFKLTTEASGAIQVGMQPFQSSSTANARLFIDYVKLISLPVSKTELQALIAKANDMLANRQPVPTGSSVYDELETAVANAQSLVDNESATVEAIFAEEAALRQAIELVEITIIDNANLQILIDQASAMLANRETVPQGSTVYTELETAVASAQAVIDNPASTNEIIRAEEEALASAIEAVEMAIFEAGLVIYEDYTTTMSVLDGENIQLRGTGQLTLTDGTNPISGSAIDLASPDAWVYFENIRPSQVVSDYLQNFTVSSEEALLGTNIRVTQYLMGAMVMAHGDDYAGLTAYDGENQSGDSMDFMINRHYKSAELGEMEDKIESFVLKHGYMATFASEENGTGVSRVYIADDADVVVDVMPNGLANTASMVVVRQWRWVTKKGWRGSADGAERFNATSNYDYNNDNYGRLDVEYVPMRHNPNWNAFSNFYNKYGSTHALGYNEPDNPVDDGYSSVEGALASWPAMMESGLRLGSPAVTDAGRGFTWLYDFMDQAEARGYRVDFIAWHFYRAGYTATQLYNQLLEIHERTGRPIWITEFNNGCNWTYNGNAPGVEENGRVIEEFIQMLDNAPFVERYYVWDGCNETLRMTNSGNGQLYPAGIAYRDNEAPMAYTTDFYNDCEADDILPYVRVNSGSWSQRTNLDLKVGDVVQFGPHPLDGGTWSWSGCGITGSAREQTFTVTEACAATATFTKRCGEQTSVTYTISGESLSAETLKMDAVKVYPNPASDKLTINLPTVLQGTQVTIIDLSGKIVARANLKKTVNTLEVSNLRSGMYLVRFSSEDKTLGVKKLIKL